MKKPTRLTKLSLDEVSLVDNPASPGASVLFSKRHDGSPALFVDAMAAQADRRRSNEALDAMWDAQNALRDSIESIIACDDQGIDRSALITETIGQFAARIQQIAPTLTALAKALENGDLIPASAGTPHPSELWKEYDMTVEELAKKLEAAEASMVELTKRATAAEASLVTITKERDEAIAKAGGTADPMVDVLKGADPAVVALFKAQEDRLARSELAITKASEAAEDSVMVAKVSATMAALPGVVPDEFAPVLRRITKGATAADTAALFGVLENADAAVKAGLLRPIGKAGAPAGAGTAEAELDTIAKGIMTAESLSFAKAYAAALARNPDLYARYKAERPKAN